MGLLNEDINYIKNRFPEVVLEYNTEGVCFRGRFIIEAKHADFIIQIAPLLELFIPYNYPLTFPYARDIDNIITYDHKFSDGKLCVSTLFDLQLKLKDSKCISDYIDGFLIPYFISYEYWKKTGKNIFGDREHAVAGVLESIQEFLCIPRDDLQLFKEIICWASRVKKFKKCIALAKQYKYLQKYSTKIAVLRSLGIIRLKTIYKLFELCENTSIDEIIKNKQFQKLYNSACS